MDCPTCTTPIPDDAHFCMSCGADVSDPTGITTASLDAVGTAQIMKILREEAAGEYEIDREIGRGGMAIVYLATDIHLKRKVAIKVLPPELTFGESATARFRREAQTAAGLDHPNIIPIYGVRPGGRLFWYAMKFLEGESLEDVLKKKQRLSLEETIEILEKIASALDYAHERHVIHRDIKPPNIMIDAQGRVVVTDFGIAKELKAGSLTSSGSVLGTPYYMSPEQCMGGRELSGAADQYSVGVMTYEMISGQVPFEADSAVELLQKHCFTPPPPLDVLRPGLPSHVYDAVKRALAKKPSERFPTVTEFVAALKMPSAVAATTALPQRASLWHAMSTRIVQPVARHRRLVWGIGAATVLTTGAVGAWWWRSDGPGMQRAGVVQEVGGDFLEPSSTALVPESLAAAQPQPGQGEGSVSEVAASTLGTETQGAEQQRQPPRDTGFNPLAGAALAAESTAAQQQAELPEGDLPREAEPGEARLVTTGRVTLTGLPPQATVFIDDFARDGDTFDLSPGQHELRVVAPGFDPYVGVVVVTASGLVTHPVNATPTRQVPVQPELGVLVVRTTGGWARISVDGTLRREGRAHRDTLLAGEHQLLLERSGYVTVDTVVTIEPGATNTVSIQMRRGSE